MSNLLIKILNKLSESDNEKINIKKEQKDKKDKKEKKDKKDKKSKSEKNYLEEKHKNKSRKYKEKLLCEELECQVRQRYVQKKPLPPNINTALGIFEPITFQQDNLIIDSIYFCWYEDPTLSRFPILRTNGTVQNYLDILNEYYAKGYRYFIGFSRSTIVAGVLQWFLERPDTKGISLFSGAFSLAVPKNIYRLIPQLDTFVNALSAQFIKATNIYYIYNENELISKDLLFLLENNELTKEKLKSYPIINESSYNVPDLSIFFNGSQPNDMVVLGIFQGNTYANLYNEGLFFPGNQYTVAGVRINIEELVEPSASLLSDKYFILSNVSPTTSLLWRENEQYLIKNNDGSNDPGNTTNALKMIQYFINNKNIDYLGSYSGTLQFNENNDLKYYSFLILQYTIVDEIKTFKKFSLSFDDPLLGTFEAVFI
jgi:hypothetical protein